MKPITLIMLCLVVSNASLNPGFAKTTVEIASQTSTKNVTSVTDESLKNETVLATTVSDFIEVFGEEKLEGRIRFTVNPDILNQTQVLGKNKKSSKFTEPTEVVLVSQAESQQLQTNQNKGWGTIRTLFRLGRGLVGGIVQTVLIEFGWETAKVVMNNINNGLDWYYGLPGEVISRVLNIQSTPTQSFQSSSDNRQIYVRNKCPHPLKFAMRYREPSGNWITNGWWNFDGNESFYLASNGNRISADNSTAYFYAETTGGINISWAGNERKVFGNTTLPMRETSLSVDSDGDYTLSLTCNNS